MNKINKYTNKIIDEIFFKEPYETELSDDECRADEIIVETPQDADDSDRAADMNREFQGGGHLLWDTK